MTSVTVPGPPSVRMKIRGKALMLSMSRKRPATRRTPRRKGRTTYTVSCQGPAPSMRAASTCSSGSTWSPARIISIVKGNHSQMSATMMAPRA